MAEAKHRDPNVPAKWTDLPVEVLHLIFGELFRDYEASYPVVELHDQDHDEVEHHENSDDGMEPRENNYYETELHTKLQYSSGRLHMVIPTPYCFAVCKSYLEAARSFVLNYSFVELRLFDLYFSQIREIVLCPDFNEIRYLKVPYAQELAVTVQAVIDAAPSLKMLVLDVGQREFGFNHLRTMLDVDEEPIAPEFDDKETTKIAQDFAAVIVTAFIVARYKDGTLFGNAIESWLKRDKEFDFCMDFTTEKSHLAEVEEFSWGHGSIHWIWVSVIQGYPYIWPCMTDICSAEGKLQCKQDGDRHPGAR